MTAINKLLALDPPWVYGPVVHPPETKKPGPVLRGEDEDERPRCAVCGKAAHGKTDDCPYYSPVKP